jgi:hypothetical protein
VSDREGGLLDAGRADGSSRPLKRRAKPAFDAIGATAGWGRTRSVIGFASIGIADGSCFETRRWEPGTTSLIDWTRTPSEVKIDLRGASDGNILLHILISVSRDFGKTIFFSGPDVRPRGFT